MTGVQFPAVLKMSFYHDIQTCSGSHTASYSTDKGMPTTYGLCAEHILVLENEVIVKVLYTYSLLRGVTFKVLPLSSYALSLTMLPLLETFL
jgi:hypothetical protein